MRNHTIKKTLVHIPPTTGRGCPTLAVEVLCRRRDWPPIPRPRAGELVQLILLEGVTNPADGATQGKYRWCRTGRQMEYTGKNGKRKVNCRGFADHATRLFYHSVCERRGWGIGIYFGHEFQQCPSSRIALWIQSVAKTWQLLATLQAVSNNNLPTLGRAALAQKRFDLPTLHAMFEAL